MELLLREPELWELDLLEPDLAVLVARLEMRTRQEGGVVGLFFGIDDQNKEVPASSLIELKSELLVDGRIVPENRNQDPFTGTVLHDQYALQSFIREDNHAFVYSVKSLLYNQEALEARIYNLSDIPKDVLKYRKRNMKRLDSRVVCEEEVAGRRILVYRVDNLINTREKIETNKDSRLSPESCKTAAVVEVQKDQQLKRQSQASPSPLCDDIRDSIRVTRKEESPKEKTKQEREATRTKQAARRARRREEGRESAQGNSVSRGKSIQKGRKNPTQLERSLKFFHALYHVARASEEVGETAASWNESEREASRILKGYLEVKRYDTMEFLHCNLIKRLMEQKSEDIRFLKTQKVNLGKLMQLKNGAGKRHVGPVAVLAGSAIKEWEALEDDQSAEEDVMIMGFMEGLLDQLWEAANLQYKELEKRFTQVIRLEHEWHKLAKIKVVQKRKAALLPFSPAYNEAHSEIQSLLNDVGKGSTTSRELEIMEDKACAAYNTALRGETEESKGPEDGN